MQCLQLALVNRMSPILFHNNARPHFIQPIFQKLNKLGYEVLHHLPCSPDLSPADCHLKHLNNFCRENTSITSLRQKILFKSSSKPEAWVFTLQEWKNLFLVGKNVVLIDCILVLNSSSLPENIHFTMWLHSISMEAKYISPTPLIWDLVLWLVFANGMLADMIQKRS